MAAGEVVAMLGQEEGRAGDDRSWGCSALSAASAQKKSCTQAPPPHLCDLHAPPAPAFMPPSITVSTVGPVLNV